MINKDLVKAYNNAVRNTRISSIRYETAKRNLKEYLEADIEKLRLELEADKEELDFLTIQLKSDIKDIQDIFVRRLAEDHYLRGEKISTLAQRYDYSCDSIKRFLRKSRESGNK